MSDQTIGSLERTEFVTLPEETIARQAHAQIEPGQAIVVRQALDGRIVAVIPPDQVAALADSDLPLVKHRGKWKMPTFVLAATGVDDVLRAMRSDKNIGWLVILRGPEAIGLVSPDTLPKPLKGPTLLLSGSGSVLLPGDPLSEPSGLCYLCTAVPPHYIPQHRVEDRSPDGRALCPCDGSEMYGTYVSPKEIEPC